MFRSSLSALLLCAALLMLGSPALASAHASLAAAPAAGPIQGTLGKPVQVGPWQVTVEQAAKSWWHDSPVLVVAATLRNTSDIAQPFNSARLFTCYRADVWQSLNWLGGDPLPLAHVAPGKETSGRLLYQLPPDVTMFGLVLFWQTPGASATGIWLLTLPH